ncbi:hypothetical protein BU23DRAFT_574555 [Bimuria novae-zelandiae CBS 107.79]|uniref:Uncharacterized protein n=1 Tax=Bimuria novae-zelandiae CBS 107.79 TaxID=1447943 RepID=A0A6A5UPE0_9PLEO|nr:hypothetical protein BU23DRAFT_574555 [Bimuria novae-zelandiae CBS 107.79]
MDLDTPGPARRTPARSVKSDTPKNTLKKTSTSPPKRVLKSAAKAIRRKCRAISRADVIASFKRSEEHVGENTEEEVMWVPMRLVVCLKFSVEGTEAVQKILAKEVDNTHEPETETQDVQMVDAPSEAPPSPHSNRSATPAPKPDISDAASITTSTQATPRRYIAPYQRRWTDESRPFNMLTIRTTLRAPSTPVPPLSPLFHWFPAAVPIDALFPPGIPLTAKELLAFYPHHIRVKGIILRLVNNGFLGDSIIAMQAFFRGVEKHPLSITNMNQFIRDSIKSTLPGIKISAYKGRPDRNMYTDQITLGHINGVFRGCVVPTFEDLLQGVKHLPSGVDARCLTQCLVWYLGVRDTFTPRLELNVLHTRALVQALRVPLKSVGPQNLDSRTLDEWKSNGTFPKRKVEDEEKTLGEGKREELDLKRSRMRINEEKETVGVDVVIKLRHVLTLPYMACGGMVCRAWEMGIEKAEARKAAREEREGVQTQSPPLRDQDGDLETPLPQQQESRIASEEEDASAGDVTQEDAPPQLDGVSPTHAQCSAEPAAFTFVTIHTAKCSVCDKRNTTDAMRRCKACTWQICRPCQVEREQKGTSLAHGMVNPALDPWLKPSMPAGYRIPRLTGKRGREDEDENGAEVEVSLGVPGAPGGPRSMGNGMASRRFASPTPRSLHSSDNPRAPSSGRMERESPTPGHAAASLYSSSHCSSMPPDNYHRAPSHDYRHPEYYYPASNTLLDRHHQTLRASSNAPMQRDSPAPGPGPLYPYSQHRSMAQDRYHGAPSMPPSNYDGARDNDYRAPSHNYRPSDRSHASSYSNSFSLQEIGRLNGMQASRRWTDTNLPHVGSLRPDGLRDERYSVSYQAGLGRGGWRW